MFYYVLVGINLLLSKEKLRRYSEICKIIPEVYLYHIVLYLLYIKLIYHKLTVSFSIYYS